MNYIDKINKIIDDIDPGIAEFTVEVNNSYIRPRESRWAASVKGDGLYETKVNRYARRTFISTKKKWVIDRQITISQIEHGIIMSADQMFLQSSPAKAPKRTKIYKSFRTILCENKGTIDFVNSIFDIAEYHHSVTNTESISSKNNDVHRKNIYQLLCLMEKSYGRGKKNSN